MSNYGISDIGNNFRSFQELISLYSVNRNKWFEPIDVSISGWFSANICSMLGAILTRLQDDLNTVTINADRSRDILERNGFLAFFGQKKTIDFLETTIPYQVLSTKDDRFFNNYVFHEFISKSELPNMTSILKRKLTESIYEIFVNAKMHSGTNKIFVCGQFYPLKQKIDFMITDIGYGIKNVVNRRFNSNLTAVQAIEWAVIDRNTTKENISGGIGLSLLYEFININKGTVQIISDDGFWQLDRGKVATNTFNNAFPGTMVNISVRTDDRNTYSLGEEIPDDIF